MIFHSMKKYSSELILRLIFWKIKVLFVVFYLVNLYQELRVILHQTCFHCTTPEMWLQKTVSVLKMFSGKTSGAYRNLFIFIADLPRINGFFLWTLRTSLFLSLLKISLMNHHMAYYKYVLSLNFLFWRNVLKKNTYSVTQILPEPLPL